MGLNLDAFDEMMASAVRHFWRQRARATKNQEKRGVVDQGNRSGVTSGKNMDGFISMVNKIIIDNGAKDSHIHFGSRVDVTIPGFYRPTKNWDLLVVHRHELVAAIEFKSQVGPSFGNNFNNRVEEALGNAVDLNTAFREGAFGESQKPFLGYFFVLQECSASTRPVRLSSPHFPTLPEFNKTSYANRYEILCRKLVQEQLYDSAALVLTYKSSVRTGKYCCPSELISAKSFAANLASKIAAFSARE